MTRCMSVTLGDPSTPCTLGQSEFEHVEYPGPISSYSWRGFILPAWVVEQDIPALVDDPSTGGFSRALMLDVLSESTPNRRSEPWLDGDLA
ncbi:hypothetical protein SEA_CRAZYRICH_2 [Microbacterium phage CrazyRich]|nr:hypothetical protein SEA_CRAZYRICH_2 [Microbacterium phage CrazyRich]